MKGYLLDTNILSDLVRNPSGPAAAHLRHIGAESVVTSVIVAAELHYGAIRKGSDRLTRRVNDILSEIAILPFASPADMHYGDIRSVLEAAGTPIGGNDLLIAAHARSGDLVMVTANLGEFARVPELVVENWLEG